MTLNDILKGKGGHVFTIGEVASLEEVTRELVAHNIGALMVCDRDPREGERLLGIITERDVIRFCASGRGTLAEFKVADIMTTRLTTGTPDDTIEAAMALMTANRIRHLPVLAEGRMVGIVSIGDLVKSQLDRLALENRFMKDYITG